MDMKLKAIFSTRFFVDRVESPTKSPGGHVKEMSTFVPQKTTAIPLWKDSDTERDSSPQTQPASEESATVAASSITRIGEDLGSMDDKMDESESEEEEEDDKDTVDFSVPEWWKENWPQVDAYVSRLSRWNDF
jgi:hypothetical protein